jgi:hypothetical protein
MTTCAFPSCLPSIPPRSGSGPAIADAMGEIVKLGLDAKEDGDDPLLSGAKIN